MKSSKIKKYLIIFLLFLSSIFGFNNQGIKIIKNDLVLGYVKTIENNRLISLNSFSTVLGYKNFVNDKTEKIVVNIGGNKIKATNGITFVLFDDKVYQFPNKVIVKDNNYFISTSSLLKLINSNKSSSNFSLKDNEIVISEVLNKKTERVDLTNEKKKWKFSTIVIDPGHGGKDPGAVGYRGTLEKDVALDVAKRLEKKISRNMDVKTVLTRDEDIFLKLDERKKIANDNNGSLFISIHANAASDRRASGFETFLIGPNKNEAAVRVATRENAVLELEGFSGKKLTNEDLIQATIAQSAFASKSEQFAALVQEEIGKRVTSRNRGVKQAGFYVLWGASMPNVLVELGFISNLSEEKKLRSSQYRETLATAIFRAVEKYEKTLNQWLTIH